MAQHILGIDIGFSSLKLVLLRRTAHTFELVDFIDQTLDHQSRLPHHELVAEELKKIFSNRHWTVDVLSVCLSSHLMSTRLIDLPLTQTKKINQTIAFELENFLPIPIEDVHFDHYILEQQQSGSKVLCVYLLKQKMEAYLQALKSVDLDPRYFGADFIDLSIAAQIGMVPHDGVYVLCDIGYHKTNICIMEGRSLKYVRTIGVGGFNFTKALQRAFNLNYEKAEALKIARGKIYIREEDVDQVARILTQSAQDLISSIKQTFLGFNNAYGKAHAIEAIYCCGGTVKMTGLMDYLSFHLRTNVLELDVLQFVDHHLDHSDEIAHAIPQALSTALRPVYTTRIPKINFRKDEFVFKQDINLLKNYGIFAGIAFFLIVVLSFTSYHFSKVYFDTKKTVLDSRVQDILKTQLVSEVSSGQQTPASKRTTKNQKRQQNLVKKALQTVETELDKLRTQTEGLTRSEISFLRIMEELSQFLPDKSKVKMQFDAIDYPGNFVIIEGVTEDYETLALVIESLKQSSLFKKVESKNERKTGKSSLQFTLNIDLLGE